MTLSAHTQSGVPVTSRRVRTVVRLPSSYRPREKAVPSAANVNAELAGTDYGKVRDLIDSGNFEAASKLAARLINLNDDGLFFTYNTTEASRRLRRAIDEGMRSSGFQSLDPALAQVLLVQNDGNRRVNARNLANIMRDISQGGWQVNGESLIISEDGRLNDGQHRCYAVLLTGKAIDTNIAFGVPRSSMRTVDTGEKRQAKDRLNIAGVQDYVRLSAISSLAFETYIGRQPTPSEADDYFHENREIIERAASAAGSSMKGVGPSAVGVASLHLLRMGFPDADIKAFFAKVRSGEMLAKNDPRMTLHRAIFVDRYKIKLSRDNWLRAFVNHYVALQEGRKPTEVQFTKSIPEVS